MTVISFLFFFSSRNLFFSYYGMMSTIDADNDDDMGDGHICFYQQLNFLNLIFTLLRMYISILDMAKKKTKKILAIAFFLSIYSISKIACFNHHYQKNKKKIVLPIYEPSIYIHINMWEKRVIFILTDKTNTHALREKEKKKNVGY
jgi:hypothetical protein